MRFLGRSLTGLFLLAATLGLLALAAATIKGAMTARAERDGAKPTARERVFSANVVTVTPQTVAPTLRSQGELTALRTLDVRARTGGTVVEMSDVFVTGGDATKGQRLLRIDPTDFEAAVELAKTDVSQAIADQKDAQSALILAGDDLANSRVQAELRTAALRRQQDLVKRRVGTEAAVENAALAEASAQQAVLSRRQAEITAQARVATAAATLSRRNIALAEAERRLAETEIFAEFSGTLSDVTALRGGVVSANEKLATLVDTNTLEVAFRVTTAQYTQLIGTEGALLNAPVTVHLDATGVSLVASGKISRESADVGDGQTGRLLFASLEESHGFRPGDFVTVEVTETPIANVAILPSSAIDAKGTVLVLGDNDRLIETKVTLLRRQGNNVLLNADGIDGMEVVTRRSPTLGAGIRIKPIREGAAPEAPKIVSLTDQQKTNIRAFVKSNTRMPDDRKSRLLEQVDAGEMPAADLEKLTARMER